MGITVSYQVFGAKVAPLLYPSCQRGGCAHSGAPVAPEGPSGAQTNADWDLQPNSIDV